MSTRRFALVARYGRILARTTTGKHDAAGDGEVVLGLTGRTMIAIRATGVCRAQLSAA